MNRRNSPKKDEPDHFDGKFSYVQKRHVDNALARYMIANDMGPAAYAKSQFTIADFLEQLKEEHEQYHYLSVDDMTTTRSEWMKKIHRHLYDLKKRKDVLLEMIEANRDRTDLVTLPEDSAQESKSEANRSEGSERRRNEEILFKEPPNVATLIKNEPEAPNSQPMAELPKLVGESIGQRHKRDDSMEFEEAQQFAEMGRATKRFKEFVPLVLEAGREMMAKAKGQPWSPSSLVTDIVLSSQLYLDARKK